MSAKASLSFDIYLRAAPQRVRAVLADPALAPHWLAGIQFQPGREEDPRRLTCEWLQSDHLEANGGSASVVRFESVSMGRWVWHPDVSRGERPQRAHHPRQDRGRTAAHAVDGLSGNVPGTVRT